MYEIIPSPGTENKTFSEIEKKLRAVQPFVRTIHIDVCDGKFAPNTTFSDPEPFKLFTSKLPGDEAGWETGEKGLFFEIHLMVEDPIKEIKKWADAGFRRFIGQVEKMPSQEEFVAEAQLYGEVGLAVDGPTPLDAVKVSYEDLDVVLFYTADKAGFSGAKFQEDRLEKVKALRKFEEYLPIEVDGGINDETIAIAAEAGVTRFVSTGFLFSLETPEKQFKLLEQKLLELTGTKEL
jgi:ribulose-phosphate 3-epimerase